MSRSYKKTPYAGDKSNTYMKKQFNRNLRRQNKINPDDDLEECYQNSLYKKVNESWDISDYGWVEPWEEYWGKCVSEWRSRHNCGHDDPYPDKEQEYKKWKKIYKQK